MMLQNVLLEINTPSHDTVFVAAGSAQSIDVSFAGTTLSTTHGATPLFYKWYSSLAAEIGGATAITAPLRVGTHTIAFAAADQDDTGVPGDDLKALYASMQHMGYAGGAPMEDPPAGTPSPLVIHLFIANMISPENGATTLSKTAPALRAEVPLQWAKFDEVFLPDVPDEKYHAVNKIQYRWSLINLTDNTQPDVAVDQTQLTYHPSDEDNDYAWLEFNNELDELVVGDTYRVTLRVENSDNPSEGHQVLRDVEIAA